MNELDLTQRQADQRHELRKLALSFAGWIIGILVMTGGIAALAHFIPPASCP